MTHDRRHYLADAPWRKQEAKLARDEGLKRTPASGAGYVKGDLDGTTFKIECKHTVLKDFRLQERVLDKIALEATSVGALPLMQIQVGTTLKVAVLQTKDVEAFVDDVAGLRDQIETVKLYEGRKLNSISISASLITQNKVGPIKLNVVPIGAGWVLIDWDRFTELMKACSISL